MDLKDIFEGEVEKPVSYKWRQNGDGSHTVRIEYKNGTVRVHTNKNKQVLVKLVKERYGLDA